MNFIADMHTHTIASTHAYSTVTENAAAAERAGIKIMAMTDHGINMPDSPHLWHFYSLGNIPRKIGNVFVLRGMEANIIDYDGNIDIFEEQIYNTLDWLNVSFHHPCCLPGKKEQHTNAYINVLRNPNVDCICHSDSQDFDYDMNAVCKVCREEGKVIEVNAARMWNDDSIKQYKLILKACEQEGTSIIVNSDAHYHDKIGAFDHVEKFLKKIKFPEELILNIDEQRMKDFIIRRRGNIFE